MESSVKGKVEAMKPSFIDSTHCLFHTNHRYPFYSHKSTLHQASFVHTPPCLILPSNPLSSSIQQRLVQIPHIILLPIVHRIRHLPHLQDIIVRHRRQRPVPLRLTLPSLLHVRIPRQIVHLRRMSSMNEQQLRRSVLRFLRRLLLSDLLSTPLSPPTRSRSHTITRRSSPAVASTFPRIGDHSPANTAPVWPSNTWYGNRKFRSSHSFTDVSELAVTNNRGKCGLYRTTLQSFA